MSKRWVALVVCLAAPAAGAQDAILDWNAVYLDSIRAMGGSAGTVAWAGAIVHTSMFDAANSFNGTYTPYSQVYTPPANALPQLAAAGAAYQALVTLYPENQAAYDAALQQSIARYGQGGDVQTSIDFGRTVASDLLAQKLPVMATFAGPWPAGTEPGQWRSTPPDYSHAVDPNLGNATPWVLQSADQFPVAPPPSLDSPEYAKAFNEVKELGALNSATRTEEQTQIGVFWDNDLPGTFKVSGHLNAITRTLSLDRGLSFEENARLFALLNLAMADASVSCWHCKYAYELWRPVTGIQLADETINPDTVPDPTWQPLSDLLCGGTPAFPSYGEGHSSFAGAFAAVMQGYFGSDVANVTTMTDDPGYTGGPRFYATFSEMAEEVAMSRIYIGVHWQFDAVAGLENGLAVGDYILNTALQPTTGPAVIPEPLTLLGLSAATLTAAWSARRRTTAG